MGALPAASASANSEVLLSDGLAELGATKALPPQGFRGVFGVEGGAFLEVGDVLSVLPGLTPPQVGCEAPPCCFFDCVRDR